MTGETVNTDDLLREARAAMDEYDPEDGQPITTPAWRLLVAVEQLDNALRAGAPLPADWQGASRGEVSQSRGRRHSPGWAGNGYGPERCERCGGPLRAGEGDGNVCGPCADVPDGWAGLPTTGGYSAGRD